MGQNSRLEMVRALRCPIMLSSRAQPLVQLAGLVQTEGSFVSLRIGGQPRTALQGDLVVRLRVCPALELQLVSESPDSDPDPQAPPARISAHSCYCLSFGSIRRARSMRCRRIS